MTVAVCKSSSNTNLDALSVQIPIDPQLRPILLGTLIAAGAGAAVVGLRNALAQAQQVRLCSCF